MRKSKPPRVDLENFCLVAEEIIEAPPKKKIINPRKQIKLEEIIAFGGLIPERSAFLDGLCSKIGPLPK